MSIPLGPASVRQLWPHQPEANERWSRSLWFERFANPRLKDDANDTPRRDFFEQGIKLKAVPAQPRAWLHFLRHELNLRWSDLRFAHLQARLLVNAGGGVMENAGVALDRFSGQPFVPGAAVKGCARRAVIQNLHDLGAGLQAPEGTVESETERAGRIQECADLLTEIARAIGWTELEWKRRDDYRPKSREGESDEAFQKRWQEGWIKRRSDFAWACGDVLWESVRVEVAARLATQIKIPPSSEKSFWSRARSFAGVARFLPAYPVAVTLQEPLSTPELGKLELDLLAAHHRKYHEGDPNYSSAPDTEDPNLVFFPAVAAGHVFVFAVLAKDDVLVKTARGWLMQGLEIFGLGAKTGSGYGWFLDVSPAVSKTLAEQEQIDPWRKRAGRFNDLSESQKEHEALAFLAEAAAWQALKDENVAKPLKRFIQQRAAVLGEDSLPWILKATCFAALESGAQEELALELSDHTKVLVLALPHFPNSLAAARDYLRANGLWPD